MNRYINKAILIIIIFGILIYIYIQTIHDSSFIWDKGHKYNIYFDDGNKEYPAQLIDGYHYGTLKGYLYVYDADEDKSYQLSDTYAVSFIKDTGDDRLVVYMLSDDGRIIQWHKGDEKEIYISKGEIYSIKRKGNDIIFIEGDRLILLDTETYQTHVLGTGFHVEGFNGNLELFAMEDEDLIAWGSRFVEDEKAYIYHINTQQQELMECWDDIIF